MKLRRICVLAILACGAVSPAVAQVRYRQGDAPRYENPYARPYGPDEDMSYATHPSFQLFDTPNGPGVRVIERCAYPDGWNQTDFGRDLNGIPTGIHHTCPATYQAGRVRARY